MSHFEIDEKLRRDIHYAALPGRAASVAVTVWLFIFGFFLLLGLTVGAMAYLGGTLH